MICNSQWCIRGVLSLECSFLVCKVVCMCRQQYCMRAMIKLQFLISQEVEHLETEYF